MRFFMFIGITKVRRKVWTIRGSNINRRAASAPPLPFPHPTPDSIGIVLMYLNLKKFISVHVMGILVWPNFCRTLLHILQGLLLCSRPITSPIKNFNNCRILTFKVNFLCQKLSESFNFFFIEEYQFRSTFFVIDIFW